MIRDSKSIIKRLSIESDIFRYLSVALCQSCLHPLPLFDYGLPFVYFCPNKDSSKEKPAFILFSRLSNDSPLIAPKIDRPARSSCKNILIYAIRVGMGRNVNQTKFH